MSMTEAGLDPSAVSIRVEGRVQGVGFRYNAQRKASALSLTGWVRNERDGSVALVCEGGAAAIAAFLDWLEGGGPPHSRISRIDYFRIKPTGCFSRFSVDY